MLGFGMRMLVRVTMTVRVAGDRAAIVDMLRFRAIDVHGTGAADRARQHRRPDGLIDDLADGAGATAALGATAQAAINLTGRTAVRCARGVAHLVVGQHIAGANDHSASELNARPSRVNENRSLKRF
jgi:hypothetical protein